jgi:MFS family permease
MFMKLSILLVTAFVDIVGLFIVIPLLPYYARALGANGLMVAVLISSFTAAQLLSAPMWGRVSDQYGRRPALLMGLGMAALAYLVFAYATSLWLLVLSRVVQGAGGGTTGIVQAYVADTIAPRDWAKALGWVGDQCRCGTRAAARVVRLASVWPARAGIPGGDVVRPQSALCLAIPG